jgi:glucose-1-phosphate thymidylyltransferase
MIWGMKAVVLAAGEGTRLRPLTVNRPKVMIKIANRPILEYVVRALSNNNIRDIILVVGYKKEQIMTYFEDGNQWNVNIEYVEQDKQVGTAHALSMCKDQVEGDILVLPGDNIIDEETVRDLTKAKDPWTVIIAESSTPSKYGVVSMAGRPITRIVEKPAQEISNLVSTGIYKLPRDIFRYIEIGATQNLHDMTSIIQSVIDDGNEVSGVHTEGKWIDAVFPWDLHSLNATALMDMEIGRAGKIEEGVRINGKVSIGEGTVIRSGTYIQGPAVVGKGCDIGPNVVILPSTTLGDNVTVNPFTEIRHSLVMSDVSVGGSSIISHSVIGDGCRIGSHFSATSERARILLENEVYDVDHIGAIVGEDCVIGNQVVVSSGMIVGTRCRIQSGKHIDQNIVDKTTVM